MYLKFKIAHNFGLGMLEVNALWNSIKNFDNTPKLLCFLFELKF